MTARIAIPNLSEAAIPSERVVLGALILDPERFGEVRLDADDFGLNAHRTIFAAMTRLDQEGNSWDLVLLTAFLEDRGELRTLSQEPVAFLASLTEGLPRRVPLAEHVSRIRKAALRREGARILKRTDRAFEESGEDPAQLLAELRARIDRLTMPYGEASPAAMQAVLNDPRRPKVILPADNRLMSDCAAELGAHMKALLYVSNYEVVMVKDGALHLVTPQTFRTLVEQTVVCCRVRGAKGQSIELAATMIESEARGILASEQFKEQLRVVERVATCRIPVPRTGGRIELLPEGYDPATRILVVSDPNAEYPLDMPYDKAKFIKDIFREFDFADQGRSLSVAVATLIGLYCDLLVDPNELGPVIIVTKNAEGAGATTIARCAVVPVLGAMKVSVKDREESEMRKALTACVLEGSPVFVLDNVKGKLDSPTLEAFTSTTNWSDRALGSNATITGSRRIMVIVTANQATFTPDLRRRSLFIELHLGVERAEDRVFDRPLSESVLRKMRPSILGACWAMVRHWDQLGRPGSSGWHSAFPAWGKVIGGIVEAAGFKCPLETAPVASAADEELDDMRALAAVMVEEREYTSRELYGLCRAEGIFAGLVGDGDMPMGKREQSVMGKILARYDDRLVGGFRFLIKGKGHQRRFSVSRTVSCLGEKE